jgi:hypothetical protein
VAPDTDPDADSAAADSDVAPGPDDRFGDRTYRSLPYAHRDPGPDDVDHDIRTPDALVADWVEATTDPGDRVFDPFAGFGTTLVTAARLDRVPYGLEYDADRVAYVRDRLAELTVADDMDADASGEAIVRGEDAPGDGAAERAGERGRDPATGALDAHVRQGDVRELGPSWFPAMDLAFTSPPFSATWLDLDPFRNYEGAGSYETYLEDATTAFGRVAEVLAPGGRLVIDVVNMRDGDRVTPLAFDLADRVASVPTLRFDGETVVTWSPAGESDDRDGVYGYGFDHSYCLAFTKVNSP